jgi:predicted DNA-binding protein
MGDIIESWAKARAGAAASRRLTVCRLDGCERGVTARGLCGAHYQQARVGKPLRQAWERMEDTVTMGSLRLTEALARQLRLSAERSGRTVSELIRRTLVHALGDLSSLAAAENQVRPGATARIGALRLPAALAERLTISAQQLGLPVSEVIRRALRTRFSGA